MLEILCDNMLNDSQDINLTNLRDYCYILVSFLGFLRFNEASRIRREHLHLFYDYLAIDIPRSKTDVLAYGAQVLIARSSDKLCILTWLTKYFRLSSIQNSDSCYIFRATYHNQKSGKTGLRKTDKVLSYSTLSDMFKNRLKAINVTDPNITLHSLRAGGVTLAAASHVPETLYKQHGRWKSDAVQSYVTHDVQKKLSVTKAMLSQ